jgi:hypothetical protein
MAMVFGVLTFLLNFIPNIGRYDALMMRRARYLLATAPQ